ncbi:MAG TPA: FecR family protein [Polyangiales bacterium]|jgi:transmembrane sensor|nr:FecR family protein [Polyangiales bacterium]
MDELARQLHELGEEIAPSWDEERSARLYAGVGKLRVRRKRQRMMIGALGAACVVCAVGFALRGSVPGMTTDRAASTKLASAATPTKANAAATHANDAVAVQRSVRVAAGQSLWLSEGSLVQVAAGEGVLDVLHDEKQQIDLRLVAGAAHFQVVPDKQRHFVVDAGSVQVAVVGTVFDVERSGERVRVSVSEGKVRVHAANRSDGESFVAAGESRWFDAQGNASVDDAREAREPDELAVEGENDRSAAHDTKRRVAHRDATKTSSLASWRSLTQAGEYDEAYRSLSQGVQVENDPAALMDAADAARLSGHPEMATTFLRRVLRDHGGSPVAPLAAFTLGRVLLERLGQPSEAAEAFARARALSPSGSLAQDALAREVEALSKAGNAHEAYLRARVYVQAYPNGRRLHAVRLYGGLERE